MEKNLSLSSIKFSIGKLILAGLLCLSTFFPANADIPTLPEKYSEIFVSPGGVYKGEMFFNLKSENTNGDKLYIVLLDENGARLHKEVFTGKNLNKTFGVPAHVGTVILIVNNAEDV